MSSEWWWIIAAFVGMPLLSVGYVLLLREWWAHERCTHYYSSSEPDVCLFCRRPRRDDVA